MYWVRGEAPNWAQPAGTAEFEHLLMSVRLYPLFVYYDVGEVLTVYDEE